MIELELLGSHADGSQLVFTDTAGERYLVTISDALRAAIRREEMQIEVSAPQGSLQPRQIQQLLRAGMEPAEIASAYGIEITKVNRFVVPVMSERSFMVSKALDMPVGYEPDAPLLLDVVVDRLATRAVDPSSLQWTATRKPQEPWRLHLTFAQAAKSLHATWEIDGDGRLLRAVDEQARWLTETLAPAMVRPDDLPKPFSAPGEPENIADVEKLLDELASARGKRSVSAGRSPAELSADSALTVPQGDFPEGDMSVSGESDFDFSVSSLPDGDVADADTAVKSGSEVATEDSPATVKLQAAPLVSDDSKPDLASDDDVQGLPGLDSLPKQPVEAEKTKRSGAKRRSVPTWDEIIFGAKAD